MLRKDDTVINKQEPYESMSYQGSSFSLLVESFQLILPTRNTWKTSIFILAIGLPIGFLIGFSDNTVELVKDILTYIIDIDIGLLGITFTGYVFFQVLVTVTLQKRLLKTQDKTSKNNINMFQKSNRYYVNIMLLYAIFIFACIVTRIVLSNIDNNTVMFSCNLINNIAATLIIFVYMYYGLYIIWELKSFIFNLYQTYNAYSLDQYYSSIKEDTH